MPQRGRESTIESVQNKTAQVYSRARANKGLRYSRVRTSILQPLNVVSGCLVPDNIII
jgi:hypothetical protein